MNENRLSRAAGFLIITAALLVLASQAVLAVTFDYPESLGASARIVLERYHAAVPGMRWAWFAFAVGALLLVPTAILFRRLLRTEESPILDVATAFGAVAGFSYTIGIMRWVLVANMLASQVVDPSLTPEARETAVLVFRALDVYLGNSFGETIAPLAHGTWVIILSAFLLRSAHCSRWLAWAQLLCGVGIATRPLEYVGWKAVAEASDIANGIWAILVVVMGARLMRAKRSPDRFQCA